MAVCVLLSAVASLHARPAVTVVSRTVRFVGTENLPTGLLLKQGSSWIPVNAPLFDAGAPLVLADAQPLEFYRDQPSADPASPAPRRVLVGRGMLPADKESLLVVLFAAPPDKDGLSLRALAYDSGLEGGYGEQALRVINLLPVNVAMQADARVTEVPPGEARSVSPKLDARYRSRFKLARQDAGQWAPMKNGLISIGPKSRVTLLVVYSATGMAHLMTAAERAQFGGHPPPGFFVISVAESVPAVASKPQ